MRLLVVEDDRRLSATDLTRRVPVGARRDELSELAATFNAMIDRLAAAVERQRRFTADASHELPSPLEVIRAEATLALDHPRKAEEYERALVAIDHQAAAMEDLLAALLLLARAETSTAVVEEMPLVDIVGSPVAEVRAARDESGIRIDCDVPDDLAVEGLPPLLTHAIRNVVDNAVKASRQGDTVTVQSAPGHGASFRIILPSPGGDGHSYTVSQSQP